MLVGGVDAHRYDLSSMVMLKDNHIWSKGSPELPPIGTAEELNRLHQALFQKQSQLPVLFAASHFVSMWNVQVKRKPYKL